MDFRGTYGISEQVSPMTNALLNDKIAGKKNNQTKKSALAGVILHQAAKLLFGTQK